MGPIERWMRQKLNPWSTTVTVRWYGGWRRPGSRSFEFPGWSWVPPQGARADPRSMPMWVRLWYMAPFIDRYAYEWMWWHGGWAVPKEPGRPH